MSIGRVIRRFVDIWVILGAILLAGTLLLATLALVWFARPEATPVGVPTAVVQVVPLPTFTPTQPFPTPTTVPVQTPTPVTLTLPPPGDFELGAYVQITGTGGDGLRLRIEPGLDGRIRFLGLESEVFQVRDGPRQVDDYLWWYLVAPFDETRNGWAVANYLTVVQNP